MENQGVYSISSDAPFSVKTKDSLRRPPQLELDVAICDFKLPNSTLALLWDFAIFQA